MGEVDLVMEEVGGGGEGLRNVDEHVSHALVDASPIRAAIDPLVILGECGKVDSFGGAVRAKVCKLVLRRRSLKIGGTKIALIEVDIAL